MKKILGLLFLVSLPGCALVQSHQLVQPYEREVLSKPMMQFDFDKTETAAREHFLNSLEGSAGGFGVGGGGCGCN